MKLDTKKIALILFLNALDYFEVPNKNRKKSIVKNIFKEEGEGGSVWDENLEDQLNPLNRYEPFLVWLPEGAEKTHFQTRLLAFDYSHKIEYHGRDDLRKFRDDLIAILEQTEHKFPGLVALLPMENILSGMWD